MQNFRNFYEILGINRDATPEQVKQAFRGLARKYHPDLNPGNKQAEEKFKVINEAYEVLSDTAKRAQYDQFGRFWQQRGFQGNAKPWGNGRNGDRFMNDVDFANFNDFNSFVDQLLNRRTVGTTAPSAPRDNFRPGASRTSYTVPRAASKNVEARLAVPLEKAYTGGRERIRLEDGRSLEVNMPPAMVDGQKIRLKGQGLNGGDLLLKIDIAPHAFYRLEGSDIVCLVPITPSEAVLGGPVEVPTLDGLVKMNIPPGVRAGQRLRLAGKGYPISEGDRGDQIVEVQIAIPRELTSEEKDLYDQLRQIETFKPRASLPV
ncbi:MAG TPA: J domain-containing protein [Leptolyngbyaceae cyanobacterium M33_DOE_097]|uniref:J domain-containing protein n=1 Tax=Oscillatoriales cyanobacterium SpSt-418 TaxID=2282169 RepID=A0A7C3KI21_9CYAN|nr:J domain-containing protein [Leptolyngbyaceae cyanobacterium M33_DOE_097]